MRTTFETRPIFRARTLCLYKKFKKSLSLQIYIRIGKKVTKLRWIPNTIANTSVIAIFCCPYIWWLLYLLMDWKTIAFVRTSQRFNQSPSTIHDINLKTSTILAKRLVLVAWLVQNVSLLMDTWQFLKFKRRYEKMEGE